jgi:hypothetical protein
VSFLADSVLVWGYPDFPRLILAAIAGTPQRWAMPDMQINVMVLGQA